MARSLSRRAAKLAADQRVRFLAVGGVNTLVGYGVYAVFAWLLSGVFLGYMVALIISYAVAITLAFVLYRRFVFVVKGNVFIDFLRFASVYAVSIAANLVALPFLVEVARLSPLAAQAIVLGVTTIVSFVGHKYFSFRRSGRADDRSEPDSRPDTAPIDSSP